MQKAGAVSTVAEKRTIVQLVDLLRKRAADHPDRPLYTFLADGESPSDRWTFEELERKARALGAVLSERGLTGARALLLYPAGLDFIAAFWGCVYGGVVAVPAYPPRPGQGPDRLAHLAADARPGVVLAPASLVAKQKRVTAGVEALAAVPWLATDELLADEAALAASWRRPEGEPTRDSLAFLQYTSGSTSTPKGVMVTHGNLLHNQEMIRRTFDQSEESVVVSWLPLYHDMGLIGGVLQPLYNGGRCILMSPTAFLKRPARWLEAIHRFRATTSGGPDFAYDLCARKVGDGEARELDLSCWKVAFNGAEPVRAATLDRFAERFAPRGFRRRAFVPCYGLAEATLLVSATAPGRGPEIRHVEAQSLARDRAVTVEADDPNARPVVSCGRPGRGVDVRVVDPESRRALEPGRVGEIWVAGDSVARGYWQRPEETAQGFGARRADDSGESSYLRTGDLGFFADGELFVAGRLKDLIVLRGLNHHPHDLERSAEAAHPELVPGGGAAFSVEEDGGERLVLALEVQRRRDLEPAWVDRVAEAVRRELAREHTVAVADVVLLRRGGLPRTSSGKVRRQTCRDLYLAGELPSLGHSAEVTDASGDAAVAARSLSRDEIDALPSEERRGVVVDFLRHEAARLARVPVDRVDPGRPVTELGLDSLGAAELTRSLEESGLGRGLSMPDLLDRASLDAVAEAVLRRAELEGSSASGPEPGERETGSFPLSPGQRALWFLHRLAPESSAYHLAGGVRVKGELDTRALAAATRDLVHRHTALRTTFTEEGDRPVQRVVAEGSARLEEIDSDEGAVPWAERPFDLETGPLFRLGLLRRPDGETRLLFVLHHLIADFASVGILLCDLGVFYARRRGLPAPELPRLPITYGDFALWQEERPVDADFWLRRWSPSPPTLELPTDRPRPPVRRFHGSVHRRRLGKAPTRALRALAREAETTPFTVLLAGLFAVLHRWSGQDDLVVGAPTAGRDVPGPVGVGELVGYFVNPVALRVPVDRNAPFAGFLETVRRAALEAFAHRDVPFARLTEILQPERDLSRSPLFDVLFAFETARAGELEDQAAGLGALALGQSGPPMPFADLELEPVPLAPAGAPFDLTLIAADVGDELGLTLRYDSDLFDPTTAVRFLDHLERLLTAGTEAPETTLARAPILSPGELHQVSWEAPMSVEPRPTEACLHGAFFHQAKITPDRTALVWENRHLSYDELASRSRRLAGRLRQLGVGPEVPVALLLPREPDLVTAILAVLAAGGAYVPLDPSYPQARLEAVLADSEAPVLVTCRGVAHGSETSDLHRVWVDEPVTWDAPAREPAPADPESLAYLIYTSGSTGRPKGVAIRHGSATALVAWARDAYSPAELSAVLAATSASFDLSVFELFAPLSTGGTVILARDVLALAETPGRDRVALVNTVPSALNELLALDAWPASVATVNLAGEPLRRALVDRLAATGTVRRVLNLYGPSEDTTYSTGASVLTGTEEPGIGRAVAGGRAWILGPDLEPQPVGVSGEIVLGGSGLARGYLGRPAATAESFVPDAFSASLGTPGGRSYRTGDLGRLRPDGGLEFLGRFDHQVKVRGFRIELGEIESVLSRHPQVAEAAVLAGVLSDGRWRTGSGAPRSALAACVAPTSEVVDPEGLARELTAFLTARLPRYMVPGVWSVHEALPRTPSGKVDRRALAERIEPVTAPAAGSEAPREARGRSPVTEILAGIWQDVLGVPEVGDEDDFFHLGGHSLLATQVVSRVRRSLGVELPVRQVFETPTLASLARAVETRRREGATPAPPIRRVSRDRPLPLSFAQERLWFLEQLEPGSAFYNIPAAVRLDGPLAAGVLGQVVSALTQRHEALRTTFADRGGKPLQIVSPEPLTDRVLRVVDLTALPREARAAALDRAATVEARRPYDLASGPLIRAALLRLDGREHALLLNLHHIVSDGWSNAVLLTEMRHLYETFSRGVPSPLGPLDVQLVDYVVWQREWLAGDVLETQLDYWRQALAGVSGLELPTDRPRPPVETFRGSNLSFRLSAEQSDRLQALARRRGVTLFAVLMAAWKTLMLRVTGQDDVPVGTPIANRTRAELEGVVGFFVNTLVLRAPLGDDPSFEELMDRVQAVALDAYAHQDLPFERLVEELAPERDMSRNPLFQVMCVLQNQPWPEAGLGEARLAPLYLDTGTAKFDLTLFWQDWEGRLHGLFEYNADLFDRTTARRLARQQRALLGAILQRPEARLWELPLLSDAESHQLLTEWNDTRLAGREPQGPPLSHLRVEAQVDRTPDAVAAVFGAHHLTYRELEIRSNRLAHRLRARGVGPEELVGICVERSLEMGVALLAVWKAGGAAVALDPAYPEDRLSFIVREAGLRVLLVDRRRAELFPEHREIQLRLDLPDPAGAQTPARRPASGAEPEHPLYAIYTSGSTGRPKGILVPHGAFANLLDWQLGPDSDPGRAPLARRARTLQNSTFGFCVSFQEVFASWASGATLVVPDEMTRRDVAGLLDFVEAEAVERLHLPFAALKHLAESAVDRERLPAALHEVITAGEQLQVTPAVAGLFERLPEGRSLHNQYGASETHVVSALTLTGSPDRWPAIPTIGRPVTDTRIHLLDRELAPVPVGVAGELYAAGPCVPRGYLADPRLTAAKVVPDPWGPPGSRMYRTGDSARYRADGRIEYHGRIDTQVKIRGFRVELGEVDTVLATHSGVRDVATQARRPAGGEPRLVAYVVPGEAAGRDFFAELSELARRKLPEYMVPAAFVEMERLPVNANGKLDASALPEPELERRSGPRIAPRTPTEETLAGIWAKVLARPVDALSVEDDFFELGGHSLLATQVTAEIRAVLGVELPLRRLFENPTLETLAAGVAEIAREEGGELEPIPRQPRDTDRFPVSFSQLREWILDRFEPGASAYNIAVPLSLEGRLDVAALHGALTRIVERHESLRTRFLATAGEPLQVVSPEIPLPLPRTDLSGLDRDRVEPLARRLARREGERSFDLTTGPLVRARLLRWGPESFWLLLTFHHSIADGWSMGVVSRELAAWYGAQVEGTPADVPELPIQYPDFAVWQRRRMTGDTLESLASYWREQLAGSTGELDLPTDRPRPPVRSDAGDVVAVRWEPSLVDRLRRLARDRGASLFMVVQAGLDALFHRYTGQHDLSTGTFIANRNRAEIRDLVGFFINTLTLRVDVSGDPPFDELVDRVREVTLGAYAHQDLPFEKLLELLQVPRDRSRTPLFQAMLVLQNLPIGRLALPGVTLERVEIERRHSDFDLTLWLWETDGGLTGHLDFATALFDRSTAIRWMRHLEGLLEAASTDPGARLSELPLLPPAERHQLLVEWNDRPGPRPDAVPAHRRFEIQARRAPDAVALVTGEIHVTYGALLERVSRWAGRLRARGVGPETVVAVATERTVPVITAFLAVLRAGAAYLPLDPDHPEERLAFQLDDARATLLLGGADALERLAGVARRLEVPTLDLDVDDGGEPAAEPLPEAFPEGLAYVLYTSGSTGEPKGVGVTHAGLGSYVGLGAAGCPLEPADRALQFAALTFDTAAEEIYPCLAVGGTLILRPEGALSPDDLLSLTAAEQVTVLNFPTSYWHGLVPALEARELPSSVRLTIVGGEAASAEAVAAWHRRVDPRRSRLVNGYGPTETTVIVTATELDGRSGAPIGRPLADGRVILLDRHGRPVPLGARGEIHAAGIGLARGYVGRSGATARVFVPDAVSPPSSGEPGERLYATGDLARHSPDGRLDFLGRRDQQVKVRGYRIEPGEVERALAEHPGVAEAVVEARRDDPTEPLRLMAWIVRETTPEGDDVGVAELRGHLGERLPAYMVPAAFVFLDALPLTRHGKVDRRALPAPTGDRPDLEAGYAPPTDALEKRIAAVWQDVLGLDRAGVHDNFFELGGDSLAILRIHQRLVEETGRQVPVLELFRYPTIHTLAERLRQADDGGDARTVQAAREHVRETREAVSDRRERLRKRRDRRRGRKRDRE